MIAETFFQLLKDPAHWLFEVFLMILFDVLIGLLLWPAFVEWMHRHDEEYHKPAPLTEEQVQQLLRRLRREP